LLAEKVFQCRPKVRGEFSDHKFHYRLLIAMVRYKYVSPNGLPISRRKRTAKSAKKPTIARSGRLQHSMRHTARSVQQ
jgi:hypothetical protein